MVSIKQTPLKKTKHETMKNVMKAEKKKKFQEEKNGVKKTLKRNMVSLVTLDKPGIVIQSGKKSKYAMPSKSITGELVDKCLNALQQLTENYKNKSTILEDDIAIFAEIHCMKIQNCTANIKFVYPHSTSASTGEICLVTPDLKKGRKVDHEPTVDHWLGILRNAGVTEIKTVLPLRQLKVEYDQFELKRRLMTQHDFIMVDTRVLSHVSHILGNMFFKKHNMLIPVRINEKGNLKRDIDIGLRTVMLRLSEGSSSVVLVGHTGMSQMALRENILSLIEQLKVKYPGGQANIRAINLKLPLSLSVPLYLTLRSSNTVNTPKLKKKKPKHFTVLEDEVTTVENGRVLVAPDGTVKVKRDNDTKTKNDSVTGNTENASHMEEEDSE